MPPNESSAGSAEDRRSNTPSPDPRDTGSASGQAVCHRRTGRQATSAVAYTGELPEDDDPLLAFAPYLHTHPRSNSITPERQRRFIATLAATGIVTQAARSIGKSMEALYKLRSKPGAEGFAAAWDAALERGMQRLEDCALERALQGTPTPIVSGGKLLGTWDKPDNNLLRFLLQHRLPARYASDSHVAPGHPLYERVRAEVLAQIERENAKSEAEIFASLERKLALIRRRRGPDGVMRVTYEGPGQPEEDGAGGEEEGGGAAAGAADASGGDAAQADGGKVR
ncbi:hypothetical protein [Alteriqipengyuania sp. 357]